MLSVLSYDFEATTFFQIALDLREEDDSKQEGPIRDKAVLERPIKMFWCGDDCVVLQLRKHLVLVGPDAFSRVRVGSKGFALYPEIDGLRYNS